MNRAVVVKVHYYGRYDGNSKAYLKIKKCTGCALCVRLYFLHILGTMIDIILQIDTFNCMTPLPAWIRLSLRTDQGFTHVHNQMGRHKLHTVCESAKCPNRHGCWNRGTATMMILGNICTRDCKFCAIPAGRPLEPDRDEPRRVALAAQAMNLNYIVITSVARDDLTDGGATIFAETIPALRTALPRARIEILTPDFGGDESALETVLAAKPDVFNHNVETVRRFQPVIRPQANYGRSLATLRYAASKKPALVVKSGIMLGLGETEDELSETFADLLSVGCELLTLGQYLRPTREHIPVARYVPPEEFKRFDLQARAMGFQGVAAGPMVRSSYRADELFVQARRTEKAPMTCDPRLNHTAPGNICVSR